ncbi:MAG: ABC transporter permease subunit, partial [Crenarchaeota archaeon]|nr:ABC transporter permease subunit [Thermoproteota archaeon]
AASELLVLLFLAVFGALASFVREADRGTLDGLRSAPVPPEAVYVSKLVYTFLLMLVNVLAYSMAVAVFGGLVEAFSAPVLSAVVASSLYLAAVSSLSSAILVFSEARGVLMPVMVLVLALPYVQLAAPVLAAGFAGGGSVLDAAGLAAAAAGFVAVAAWLSRYVLEVF